MKIISKILISIIAIPFAIIGGLFCGLIKLFVYPCDLVAYLISDIWGC